MFGCVHKTFNTTQSALNGIQMCCIVGALVVSPVKAIVSMAQIITNMTLGIFLFFGGLLMCGQCGRTDDDKSRWLHELSLSSKGVVYGIGNLAYSTLNILSLGLASTCIESAKCCFRCCPISL